MPHVRNPNDLSLIATDRRAWSRLRVAIMLRDGGKCQKCGRPAEEVDHIVERTQGGTDDPSNLRSLCKRCHDALGRHRRELRASRNYMVRPDPGTEGGGYSFSWHYHRQQGNFRQVLGATDVPEPLPDCATAGCTLR